MLAVILWLFAAALIALLLHEWQDLPDFAVWQAQANFARQLGLYAGETLLAVVAIITGIWLLRGRRANRETEPPIGQKLSPRTKLAAVLVVLLLSLIHIFSAFSAG